MKKKIVAYLLCMAMGVSLLPMPVTQAADNDAVVYEEPTTEEEQDSYVQVQGLKAFADCGNATNSPDEIVDGDKSTYWHSAWEGEMQPEKQEAYTEMSKNNNIILKLAQTSAVKKIVYLSNGENSNGTISKCNLYIKKKQDNTEKFEQVGNEPYTLEFNQNGAAEIDFETAFENVAEIKIEVLNTNGDPSNTFISGKELSVFQDEEQTEAIKIMANAECSSQKDQGIAKLVDGKEETVYHSTWGDDSGPTLEDGEEFEGKEITKITRPETTTTPSELIKNNKIYILLPKEENVARLVYTSRQEEKNGNNDGVNNGRITGVNIYVSKEEKSTYSEVESWTKASEETVNWAGSEEDQVFDFKPEQEGVRWICLEVKHSAGSEEDKFINAAEIAVEVKKTELQKAIEELQNLLNDENYKNAYDNPFDYTEESWREFQDAYNKAEAILKKENLSEQDIPDIRSAKTNLITAKDNLIGIVEKPTLNLAKPEVGKKFPKAAFENTEDTDFSKIMDIETVWKDSDSKDVTIIDKHYKDNPQKYVDGLKRMSIDQPLNLQISGEGKPNIKGPKERYFAKTTLPWMSIGYETQVPPLNILTFYNAIANNGTMVRPKFVRAAVKDGEVIKEYPTEVINPKICSDRTLTQIRDILEKVVTVDILALIFLTALELVRALRYAALNRELQKKVYLDEATGIPNKNKCEELLSAAEPVTEKVALCVFDLNNLRVINNSLGHEKGDAYIRNFAQLLYEIVPKEYFVGRNGGDEFIVLFYDMDHLEVQEQLKRIEEHVAVYSATRAEMPISYAVGYALSKFPVSTP